jgi:hypothetical protein
LSECAIRKEGKLRKMEGKKDERLLEEGESKKKKESE